MFPDGWNDSANVDKTAPGLVSRHTIIDSNNRLVIAI